MVKTKVFVGNLSFKTTEAELATEFAAAGTVTTANIITRGPRSLGYGFVELNSEEEAKKAVELLNKKVIDGREINVEVAKPQDETVKREPRPARPRRPRQAGDDAAAGTTTATTSTTAGGAAAPAEGDAARRRQRRPRRAPRQQGDGTPAAAAPAGAVGAAGSAAPKRERRPPREKKEEGDRNPSKTTLFVANLPFSVDDEGLSKLFAGYNLKSAHVVRKRNTRSKGFGFVEFSNEADQTKALAVNDTTVEGRQLIVKVALTEQVKAEGAGEKEAPKAEPKP